MPQRLASLHRYLGMALALMLALWFFTGAVQSFVPFPTYSDAARLTGAQAIDWKSLRVAPLAAAHLIGSDLPGLRLISVAGTPRYAAVDRHGAQRVLDANDGRRPAALTADAARTIIAGYSAAPFAALTGPWRYDQWTIHGKYNAARPYWRVAVRDAAASEYYVSALSGEVLQKTTRRERAWNRVGAVVHWLNVPALRMNYAWWHRLIWSVALAGLLLLVSGLLLGYWRALQQWSRRAESDRSAASSRLTPYRGLLGWHHRLGLIAGLIALSWLLSGWLSLDDGLLFSAATAEDRRLSTYRASPSTTAWRSIALEELHPLPAHREWQFTALNGEAMLIGRDGGLDAPVVYRRTGATDWRPSRIDAGEVALAIERAWSPARIVENAPVSRDDAYFLRRQPPPPMAWRFKLDDDVRTWVQVDLASGDILSVTDRSRRVYRWLVDGLHTLDFPWLNHLGSTWQVLMLAAMILGFTLSMFGIALAFQRVRRWALHGRG